MWPAPNTAWLTALDLPLKLREADTRPHLVECSSSWGGNSCSELTKLLWLPNSKPQRLLPVSWLRVFEQKYRTTLPQKHDSVNTEKATAQTSPFKKGTCLALMVSAFAALFPNILFSCTIYVCRLYERVPQGPFVNVSC